MIIKAELIEDVVWDDILTPGPEKDSRLFLLKGATGTVWEYKSNSNFVQVHFGKDSEIWFIPKKKLALWVEPEAVRLALSEPTEL